MDISLWMTRDPIVAHPTQSLAELSRTMATRGIRHLPVLEPATGQLVGMVTSHALFLAAGRHNPLSPLAIDANASARVLDVMEPAPRTVRSDAAIDEAARLLRDTKAGVVPVVNDGKLVGILTDHDLLRAFLEMSGADEGGCEVTLEPNPGADPVTDMVTLGKRHGLTVRSVVGFRHGERHLSLVRFSGSESAAFVGDLWRTGNRVLRVRHGAAHR